MEREKYAMRVEGQDINNQQIEADEQLDNKSVATLKFEVGELLNTVKKEAREIIGFNGLFKGEDPEYKLLHEQVQDFIQKEKNLELKLQAHLLKGKIEELARKEAELKGTNSDGIDLID